MQKIIIAMGFIIFIAISVKADDTAISALSDDEWCPDGIVERGAHTTKRYCRSKKTMNWYEAVEWCETQKMHLATVSEICDKGQNEEAKWDGTSGNRKCPNFLNYESSFNSWAWTGTVHKNLTDAALCVYIGLGHIGNNNASTTTYRALCY